MARNNAGLALSPTSQHLSDAAPASADEMLEALPPTKRLTALDLENVLAGAMRDDEPTLDVPAPPSIAIDETLTLQDLGLDLDDEFPLLGRAPSVSQRDIELHERRTRQVVCAIWTFAIALAAAFTYLVVTTESARASQPPSLAFAPATVEAPQPQPQPPSELDLGAQLDDAVRRDLKERVRGTRVAAHEGEEHLSPER